MTEVRSFPEAANGLPQAPMEAELWAAGCDLETARFVAKQLDREGYVLIKPETIWEAHKNWNGERKYALRQIIKFIRDVVQAETVDQM
jgi:hypothetical protein